MLWDIICRFRFYGKFRRRLSRGFVRFYDNILLILILNDQSVEENNFRRMNIRYGNCRTVLILIEEILRQNLLYSKKK